MRRTATTPAVEARRLIDQLFTLETSTLVVAEPSARVAPTMEEMLADLHETYRKLAAQPPTAAFSDIGASAARRDGERHLLDRVARVAPQLHDMVDRACGTVQAGRVTVDERRLTPADAATIARAWELARDPVHLTTNVGLGTGDVLTHGCPTGSSRSTDAVIGFHGDMAALGVDRWEALIALVGQFLTTAIGLILRRAPAVRAPRAVAAPTARRELLIRRAHALFGTGGKLFLTDSPDGSPGGIRTLVQLQGDVLTRITPACLGDLDRLARHRADIDAWFARLERDWRRARRWLNGGAVAAAVAFEALDVRAVAQRLDWHAAALVLPPVLALALRAAVAIAARRFILHATKGVKALLPARG